MAATTAVLSASTQWLTKDGQAEFTWVAAGIGKLLRYPMSIIYYESEITSKMTSSNSNTLNVWKYKD